MANTPVRLHFPDGLSPTTILVESLVDGQVEADPAGYSVSVSLTLLWTLDIVIPEACAGVYRLVLLNGDGVVVGQRYIYLVDNITRQYARATLGEALLLNDTATLLANLASGNGTITTTQGDHTAALAALASSLANVIKSGEAFSATSAYESPRTVTFTRL